MIREAEIDVIVAADSAVRDSNASREAERKLGICQGENQGICKEKASETWAGVNRHRCRVYGRSGSANGGVQEGHEVGHS
jgi:hypothetical protein